VRTAKQSLLLLLLLFFFLSLLFPATGNPVFPASRKSVVGFTNGRMGDTCLPNDSAHSLAETGYVEPFCLARIDSQQLGIPEIEASGQRFCRQQQMGNRVVVVVASL
jgi:hypothetical protein